MDAQLAELGVQLLDGGGVEPGEELEDPRFVLARHRLEAAPAFGRQADDPRAPVGRVARADDDAFARELVGEPGDVAAGHHQELRQLAHLHAVLEAVELRHVVEARERDAEALAEPPADLGLDLRRAREHAQPQPQRRVVAAAGTRLVTELLSVLEDGVRRVVLHVQWPEVHAPSARFACSSGDSPAPCAASCFSRSRLRSSWSLAERYCFGHSISVTPIFAASSSVHAGLARCGRAIAHRSARPAATMLLTWSASEIAPTAIVAMPASLRMRS